MKESDKEELRQYFRGLFRNKVMIILLSVMAVIIIASFISVSAAEIMALIEFGLLLAGGIMWLSARIADVGYVSFLRALIMGVIILAIGNGLAFGLSFLAILPHKYIYLVMLSMLLALVPEAYLIRLVFDTTWGRAFFALALFFVGLSTATYILSWTVIFSVLR